MPLAEGADPPSARVLQLTARVRELERDFLRGGVNQVFAIAHSNYENIDLEVFSKDYPDVYEPHELNRFESEVAPLSRALVKG